MISKFVVTNASKKQVTDTGMAIVLIMLLLGFILNNTLFFKIAIPVLVINMTVPVIFYPFALFWLSLSNLLGTIVSKLVLSIVFFIIVMPVGLLRRILKKDTLLLKEFKSNPKSVLITRNFLYSSKDIEVPY